MSGYTISITGNSNDSDLVLSSSAASITENGSSNLVPLTGRVNTLETSMNSVSTNIESLQETIGIQRQSIISLLRQLNQLSNFRAFNTINLDNKYIPFMVMDIIEGNIMTEMRHMYKIYYDISNILRVHHNHSNYTTRYHVYDNSAIVPNSEADTINSAVRGHTNMRINIISQSELQQPQFQSSGAMLSYLQSNPNTYHRNLFGHEPANSIITDWSNWDSMLPEPFAGTYTNGTDLPDISYITTTLGSNIITVTVDASLSGLLTNGMAIRMNYTGSTTSLNGIPATELISHPYTGIDVSNVTDTTFDVSVITAATASGMVSATGKLNTAPNYLPHVQYFVNEYTYFYVCRDDGNVDIKLFYRYMIPSESEVAGMRYAVQEEWIGDDWIHQHPTPSPYGNNMMGGSLPTGFNSVQFSGWGDLTTDRFYKHAFITRENLPLYESLADMGTALNLDLSAWESGFDPSNLSLYL